MPGQVQVEKGSSQRVTHPAGSPAPQKTERAAESEALLDETDEILDALDEAIEESDAETDDILIEEQGIFASALDEILHHPCGCG